MLKLEWDLSTPAVVTKAPMRSLTVVTRVLVEVIKILGVRNGGGSWWKIFFFPKKKMRLKKVIEKNCSYFKIKKIRSFLYNYRENFFNSFPLKNSPPSSTLNLKLYFWYTKMLIYIYMMFDLERTRICRPLPKLLDLLPLEL